MRRGLAILGAVLLLGSAGCGCAESNTAIRIMPLGDSITQGSRSYDSYRRALWRRLQEAGYAVDFVGSTQRNHGGSPPRPDFDLDHEGHWGWRVDQVLAELEPWAQAAQPDVVLVHLGSNDLFRPEEPAAVVQELRAVVETLRRVNPRVVILLAEIIPAGGGEAPMRAYNAGVRALAGESFGESRVKAVDLFTGFDPERHTYDGVHPNKDGEALMADRWFEALRPILDARR